jgi:hypothetical protein
MTSSLEYHVSVRHSIPASLALFSLLALSLVLVSTSHAQINGVPSSVTSPGFGGRPVNGTPPSVTSLGPNGSAPNFRVTLPTLNTPHTNDGRHHHHHGDSTPPPVVYTVPVPYALDLGAADDDDDASARPDDRDADPQAGPSTFDRRGSRADSYLPPAKDLREPDSVQSADDAPADPDTPQEPTLLVFKDGRKLELLNYAIIGATLFDLTPGHPRKVALADLDLEATRKLNDDRGVTFQLPPPPRAK